MRRLPPRLANSEIDRRLTKIDRQELAMDVSNMQQRDIAECVKPEKLRFTQVLLCDRAHESAVACRESRGGNTHVKNFTASNHRSPFQVIPSVAPHGPGRTSHETEGPQRLCEPRQCLMPGTLSFCPSF
jgi:hypothetical protein